MPSYFVYILRCRDQSLYVGITNDLTKRLARHQQGTASRYTRSRLPVTLVYKQRVPSKSAALKREYQIRQLSRAKKLLLIS